MIYEHFFISSNFHHQISARTLVEKVSSKKVKTTISLITPVKLKELETKLLVLSSIRQ